MQPESAKYNGLSNQGATCYLNSLLQSLFMTPEFRNALYRYDFFSRILEISHKGRSWNPTFEKDHTNSITYQLARLFLLLQSAKRSVSTKPLTKSFGWVGGEGDNLLS